MVDLKKDIEVMGQTIEEIPWIGALIGIHALLT
jgi:hypothetical protein